MMAAIFPYFMGRQVDSRQKTDAAHLEEVNRDYETGQVIEIIGESQALHFDSFRFHQ